MRLALRKAGSVVEPVEVHVTEKGVPKLKKINKTVAVTVRATLEKSKLNAPHRDVMFDFDFRNAKVDEWYYLVTQCLDVGAIEYNRKVWTICEGKMKGKKFRGREEFEAAMTEKDLLTLLNRVGPEPLGKSKEGSLNGKTSKRVVRRRIQTRGQGGSKTTVRTVKRSTKSKTRSKVTR
jgi:hypothetical protein